MSRYRQTMAEALKKVYEQDKDHEISMARGELEAIADKATQLASILQGKSDEGNPLEAWVQSKITKAKDYINSVSDYMMYNPDMKQNEETILEYTQQQIKQAYGILNDPRYKGGNYDGAVKAIEKLAKGLSNHPDVKNALKRANEETEGRPSPTNPTGKELDEITSHTVRYLDPLNKKRFAIPYKTHADAEKKMAQLKKDGVKEIEITMDTLKPGMSFKEELIFEKTYDEKKYMKKEPKEVKEKEDDKEKMKSELEKKDDQIALLKQKIETDKAKAVQKSTQKMVNPETGEPLLQIGIAYKHLKDKMKKEEVELDEFTTSMIKDLQKSYADLKGKTISPEKATALSKQLDGLDVPQLKQLVSADIPFVTTIAKNKLYKKTGKFEEVEINEIEDYGLKGTISDKQLQNIKSVWANKTKKDITPGIKSMLSKLDSPTRLAIKMAKINVLSDLVEELDESKLSTIEKMKNSGKSAQDISKKLNIDIKLIKDILGEEFGDSDELYLELLGEINEPEINKHKKDAYADPKKGEKKIIDPEPKLPKLNNEERRLYIESIAAVKTKAEKTGMPYSILKQVYDRGMAAWRGGHRPGATQVQWALARVNSFVTKSSGTWGGADSDLAAKIKGSK